MSLELLPLTVAELVIVVVSAVVVAVVVVAAASRAHVAFIVNAVRLVAL